MKNEFIPYTEALKLKELGFNEKCIGVYYNNGKKFLISETLMTNSELDSYNSTDSEMSTPLYQQAFRWFREKHNLHCNIDPWGYCIFDFDGTEKTGFETYKEAELECLKKLIEIVK